MVNEHLATEKQEGAAGDLADLRRGIDVIAHIASRLEKSLGIPISVWVEEQCEDDFCCMIEKPLASLACGDAGSTKPYVWISATSADVHFMFYLAGGLGPLLEGSASHKERVNWACDVTADWLRGRISDDELRAAEGNEMND